MKCGIGLVLLTLTLVACEGVDGDVGSLPGIVVTQPGPPTPGPTPQPGDDAELFAFANRCVAVGLTDPGGGPPFWLLADGTQYAVAADARSGSKFFLKASDLGTFLLYDEGGGYVSTQDGAVMRATALRSDVYEVDDDYISGAEWQLEFSERVDGAFQLRQRRSGLLLSERELVETAADASAVELREVEGCTPHPEASLDATATSELRTTYDDGTLYGFVDSHSHILANFGFGGGGIMHGAPFHRLGVEVALGTCKPFHGPEGRADFLGWGFGSGSSDIAIDQSTLVTLLGSGRLPEPNHATDGWPTFSDWPSQESSTHQTQYYRWLERAWLGGLRLVVQHAVSNEIFCELMKDTEFQPTRYGCEDMRNVDRQLVEVRNMERYIDAQHGGVGLGWFRVVESPEQAREVIAAGKLAVVLGIEVPNLFDCYLTPQNDAPTCDAAHIQAQLDEYYARGVRVVFPNHKFDNAFTPGDGHRGMVELGNFFMTAHYSNFVTDCPDVDTVFDKGPVQFGGFNVPRDDYLEAAPNDLIQLTPRPLPLLLPYFTRLSEPSLEGDWCQKAGLTEAGVTLLEGMMDRGIVPEIDHLPRRSYLDAFGVLEAADYPAVGTHGLNNDGKLYELGGLSKTGIRRCADPDNPGSLMQNFRERRDQLLAAGQLGAEGFGFDYNGLAGVVDSRFGPDANCAHPQTDPVEYPFTSLDGAVAFTPPAIGERAIDFNNEGMVHIGLVPELLEDARRTGATEEDFDIIFKSAEAYVRVWERAEERASTR